MPVAIIKYGAIGFRHLKREIQNQRNPCARENK